MTRGKEQAMTLPPGGPIDKGGSAVLENSGTHGGVPVRIVVATVAGNALEFYDFITYAFFAVYIGQAFFPASTPWGSLLLSVAVFGVGFVFRPLGALVIGAFADRAGRRPALLLTIGLITAGTLGLAVTPSYQSIGIAAPILVVACRLVQGLALGGEVGPASAFLIEIAPAHRRGLYTSWQLASQGMSALAAGAIGFAMSLILAPAELAAWGWRVPFLLCLLLIPIAGYLRHAMPETLVPPIPVRPVPVLPIPVTEMPVPGMPVAGEIPAGHRQRAWLHTHARLRTHAWLIMIAVLVIMGGTISTYVGSYMTTYAIATLKLAPSLALAATVVGGTSMMVFALVGGWLSDQFGRRPVMLVPRIVLAVITWPLFLVLDAVPAPATLFLVTALLSALTAISATASIVAIPELLPRPVRATGLAVAYALGVSLFGGTTQFVITWLIKVTGDPAAPGWYVTITSVICVFAILAMPESRHRKLEG
jgi:MFS family permease